MDIEEIKKQYAEFYEDELLIEKQKDKLVKELKSIIKDENITSSEDEEKNEEIQKLKVAIQEIQAILDNLEKEKKDLFNKQHNSTQKILEESERDFKRKNKEQERNNNFLELLRDLKAQGKAKKKDLI